MHTHNQTEKEIDAHTEEKTHKYTKRVRQTDRHTHTNTEREREGCVRHNAHEEGDRKTEKHISSKRGRQRHTEIDRQTREGFFPTRCFAQQNLVRYICILRLKRSLIFSSECDLLLNSLIYISSQA